MCSPLSIPTIYCLWSFPLDPVKISQKEKEIWRLQYCSYAYSFLYTSLTLRKYGELDKNRMEKEEKQN